MAQVHICPCVHTHMCEWQHHDMEHWTVHVGMASGATGGMQEGAEAQTVHACIGRSICEQCRHTQVTAASEPVQVHEACVARHEHE